MGHQTQWWVDDQKSIYDILDEYNPDVFLIPSYNLNEPIINRICESPEMHVVLIGSNFGPIDKEIDPAQYPVLKITDDEKGLVSVLRDEHKRCGTVVCNYHPNKVDMCMAYWRSLGYEPKSLMNAADTFTYMGGSIQEHYKCDISMISGKWPYKSRNLDKFFLPLCYPVGRYNVKIWGWGWEVIPQYLGQIAEEEVKHVFASSKITVNIHEPHSNDFGFEATERMYKALIGGSLVISDYVGTIEEDIYPNGEIPMAKTPLELEDLVQLYLHDDEKRANQLALGRRQTFRYHTYLDRVADLFTYLDMPGESAHAVEVKNGQNLPTD